jgi:predicted RecA/RadA family phage recombinase
MLNRLPSGVDALVSGGSAERVGSCFPVSAPAARSAELAAERLMFSLPASEADALVAGPWAERVMLGLSVSALRVWGSASATLEAVSDKATAPAATIAAVCLASFVDILLSEAWMKRCSCNRLNPPLHVNCKAVAARGPSIFGPSSEFSR